jgi:zinc/manganese transport system ATP-binding protein
MKEFHKDIVIATHSLSLGYHHKPLVSDVSLYIEKGKFIGVLGSNGSGKSTFLRALLGLIKPLAGELTVLEGTPPYGNKHIGYMPQLRTPIPVANLTSRALLEAACDGLWYGLPLLSKTKKDEVQNKLDIVKATAYADRPFKQLSGGERQRIYLAQALLGGPSMLLLDEPLSNLDPKYQEIFIALLNDIRRDLEMTILLTAHDPNPLLPIMNQVLFFANGKAALGSTDDIITSATLSAMYGTPIEVVRFRDRLFVLSETQQNILGEVRHHHD